MRKCIDCGKTGTLYQQHVGDPYRCRQCYWKQLSALGRLRIWLKHSRNMRISVWCMVASVSALIVGIIESVLFFAIVAVMFALVSWIYARRVENE